MSNVQTDTVAQMGQYSHKISAIANSIDFETVSLSLIIKDQSGPPENFILAGACLKVSETRCDVSGNSGYYRVEAAVSPHHRHAGDAQPSAQPIDHAIAQSIDSIDHGPTIDPTIGSGPAIGEAGARGLGPAGARAGHRPQGPRARHAAAGGDPAPGDHRYYEGRPLLSVHLSSSVSAMSPVLASSPPAPASWWPSLASSPSTCCRHASTALYEHRSCHNHAVIELRISFQN